MEIHPEACVGELAIKSIQSGELEVIGDFAAVFFLRK